MGMDLTLNHIDNFSAQPVCHILTRTSWKRKQKEKRGKRRKFPIVFLFFLLSVSPLSPFLLSYTIFLLKNVKIFLLSACYDFFFPKICLNSLSTKTVILSVYFLYFEINSFASDVKVAPPPPFPPVATFNNLIPNTFSVALILPHAARYDMPNSFDAAFNDPRRSVDSSSILRPSAKATPPFSSNHILNLAFI